ncbi:phage shock protein PspC (stress-responsive transcriptional regulator) [Microbacterium sp. BE35]|uniref:PspC domain-containing protein n=1 Tax=Microbacterium sp. BE35 TaxID=2817773 RepID=UPI00285768E7|nr:PspC domain-containing protein [Microbacterium sp. BE35]MDR7188891.1 phage shock protein PspC (stress-responsive transcriptional regulator) [Microbacterium sp. BE35]
MTDATTAAPTDPGPPPTAPPGLPTGTDRFFSWVEGLGIVRADGWLGGVCGGLAARLRIDPIIVRGIFVVVALFGFPALLVYAIAWALLPDTSGRIHLRELFHGRYDAAMTGVFILAVVGFVPVVPWLRNILMWPLWALTGFAPWAWDGSGIWDLGSPFGGIGVILTLALIGTAVYFIVRAAQAGRPSRAGAPMASAPPAPVASHSGADAAPPLAADAAGIADPAGRAPAGSATGSKTVPAPTPDAAAASPGASGGGGPAAPAGALPGPDAGDVAAADWRADWRATQEQWRVQNDAWRRSQQDAARAAREQARRERHAHGAAFALDAEERRRARRASYPRTSFAFVLTTLGAAVVAGALAVLVASSPGSETAPYAGAIGLFTAAVITALAMVVAGAFRRRSGLLTAVTIVLLVIGSTVAAASGPQRLVIGSIQLGTATYEQTAIQPFGSTFISVGSLSDSEDIRAGGVVVTKGVGGTDIVVHPGTVLELDATLGDGVVLYSRIPDAGGEAVSGTVEPDADGEVTWRAVNEDPSSDALTTQHVTLDQRTGSVQVTIFEK